MVSSTSLRACSAFIYTISSPVTCGWVVLDVLQCQPGLPAYVLSCVVRPLHRTLYLSYLLDISIHREPRLETLEVVWTMDPHFVFKNVKLTVGKRNQKPIEILHGVSGCFSHNTLTAIVGPSGCGKSSLLDIIAGRKTAGKITGCMSVGSSHKPPSIVGYVEQNHALLEHLTVEEYFRYMAQLKLHYATEKQQIAAINDAIQALDLDHCKQVQIGGFLARGLSGGEHKRVAVGTVLLMRPKLLLLDEPTSGLDSVAATNMMAVLSRISKQGSTAVACTLHAPSRGLYSFFSNLMIMLSGKTVYFGHADDAAVSSFFLECRAVSLPVVEGEWAVDMNGEGLSCAHDIVHYILHSRNDRALADHFESVYKMTGPGQDFHRRLDALLSDTLPPAEPTTLLPVATSSSSGEEASAEARHDHTALVVIPTLSTEDSMLGNNIATPEHAAQPPVDGSFFGASTQEVSGVSSKGPRGSVSERAPFFQALCTLLKYRTLKQWSAKGFWATRVFDKLPPVLIFSLLMTGVGRNEGSENEVALFIFVAVFFSAVCAKNNMNSIIIADRAVFEREHRHEKLYSSVSYALVLVLTELPVWTFAATWHVMVPILIVGFNGSWLVYVAASVLMAVAGGLYVCLATSLAQSVPVAALITDFYILGTLIPTTGAMFRISRLPDPVAWYHRLNPMYHTFVAMLKCEMETRGNLGAAIIESYGIEDVMPWTAISLLWAFVGIYAILLLLALKYVRIGER